MDALPSPIWQLPSPLADVVLALGGEGGFVQGSRAGCWHHALVGSGVTGAAGMEAHRLMLGKLLGGETMRRDLNGISKGF